jgi:predicted patatin/cPLA2 family phospholipase
LAKTGLVLEGGAMRGMFTAGVTDVFMENGIDFDGVIGVSAGAAFGCNYKSRQIGRTIRYNKRFCRNWHYAGFRSWLLTGNLYNADFDYRLLPDRLDPWDTRTFAANPQEFWCVCTDAQSGEACYFRCMDGGRRDLDLIRASASMPIASKPVEVDGKKLLDGGISDSIPLRFFEKQGYDRNVVLLTQPRNYRKEPLGHEKLLRFLLRKTPKVAERLANRHNDYNKEVAYVHEEEKKGSAFVICPDEPLGIGSICHDPDELQRVYDIGRKKGEKVWRAAADFLREGTGT